MSTVSCSLNVAGWSINTANNSLTDLIALDVRSYLQNAISHCYIIVHVSPTSPAGMITGALAAGSEVLGTGERPPPTSVKVGGQDITCGDSITIELTSGEISAQIITAEVENVRSCLGLTMISGSTAMHRLAYFHLNQVYENQSMSQIVRDLAGQAGVDPGQIETGSTYPYFIVHQSKSSLQYFKELAMRNGLDLYFDTDNKLTMKSFNKSSADHVFTYGQDILDLQLSSHQAPYDRILVCGESSSSNQGPDTWHWIAKDIGPFQGKDGIGSNLLSIQDGAVRTKDAADSLAKAKLGAMKDQSVWGRLKTLGNPTVKLADAIEIKNVPRNELNGLFKVTEVRHLYSKQKGYVTYIGFSGHGGVRAADNLPGNQAGGLGL